MHLGTPNTVAGCECVGSCGALSCLCVCVCVCVRVCVLGLPHSHLWQVIGLWGALQNRALDAINAGREFYMVLQVTLEFKPPQPPFKPTSLKHPCRSILVTQRTGCPDHGDDSRARAFLVTWTLSPSTQAPRASGCTGLG